MENYICALILLVFVFIFTGVNSFIICSDCDEMMGLIDEGKLEEAITLWEEKRDYISIFVRDTEIDAVDTAATDASDDSSDRLKNAIQEIKNSEHLSFHTIFCIRESKPLRF